MRTRHFTHTLFNSFPQFKQGQTNQTLALKPTTKKQVFRPKFYKYFLKSCCICLFSHFFACAFFSLAFLFACAFCLCFFYPLLLVFISLFVFFVGFVCLFSLSPCLRSFLTTPTTQPKSPAHEFLVDTTPPTTQTAPQKSKYLALNLATFL